MFSEKERAGFQSTRFSGFPRSDRTNVVKLLFTKP